jgi:signal transduction histidine kinase
MAEQITTSSPDRVRILRTSVTKWQLKVGLILLGLALIATVLLATKSIVDELVANEVRTVRLYVQLLERSYEATSDEELLFYLEKTYSSIHFPVIITDKNGKPTYPYQQFMMNVPVDSTLPVKGQEAYLTEMLDEMQAEYPPFEIKTPEGKVVQKIYYTNSDIVRRLKYLPVYEILAAAAFILIGYVAFSTIRRNEQSNVWVGMAKEAAHQLGTPLSSLLAWLEILRMNKQDPSTVERTADEMLRDVDRLNVIANRFSKIGSKPNMERIAPAEIIENVIRYFETRLPHQSRRIHIERSLDPTITCDLGSDLFAWVIENLIKNAVDAMEQKEGHIWITLERKPRGGVLILVSDDGKGMTSQVRSKIFQPGFTTKRRGWGLGLSLSKRIIEEYHGGRITVRDTAPGKGTTFAIELG